MRSAALVGPYDSDTPVIEKPHRLHIHALLTAGRKERTNSAHHDVDMAVRVMQWFNRQA